MPIYEYECKSCRRRSEAIQRLADPPLITCGECGGELRKMISAPAFQFKGTGWYVTDYADKSSKGKDDDGDNKTKGEGSGEKSESSKDASTKSSSDGDSKKAPPKADTAAKSKGASA